MNKTIEIMKQEDREVLLKDLCARLPYGVKIQVNDWAVVNTTLKTGHIERLLNDDIELKPYLRPMSSMTEEEKQILELCNAFVEPRSIELKVDFYNQHHLDYRGLIEKGLAIEVTEENNPYVE